MQTFSRVGITAVLVWAAASCGRPPAPLLKSDLGLPDAPVDARSGQVNDNAFDRSAPDPDQALGSDAQPCPKYHTACNGSCVNTMTSLSHCGACNSLCSVSQWPGYHDVHCYFGKCVHGYKKNCGGSWVDPEIDPNNCGDCGFACDVAGGFTCLKGKCVCNPFSVMACGTPPKCVEWADPKNCGVCGVSCNPDEVCKGNVCLANDPCPGTKRQCGGSCVDTSLDPDNCGACGASCPPGMNCHMAQCQCALNWQMQCAGTCIDIGQDPSNCGGCGFKCWPGASCGNGSCY